MGALESTKLFGRACKLTLGFLTEAGTTQVAGAIATSGGGQSVQAFFNDSNGRGVDVSGHDMEFVVEKSLKPGEPNTCSMKVYNLSGALRQALSGFNVYNPGNLASGITVLLEAGYLEQTSQIYFAGARAAWSQRINADYVTHIESMDTIARPTGLDKTKKIPPGAIAGAVYHTTGARIPLSDAMNALAKAMGVGVGNLAQVLSAPPAEGESITGATIPATAITSVNGSALIGNSARRMTDICRSAGLEWSVQDGVLQNPQHRADALDDDGHRVEQLPRASSAARMSTRRATSS